MADEKATPSTDDALPEIKFVTKQLLETAIRNAEKSDSLTVIDFTVRQASSAGDNFATVVLAAKVKVQDVSEIKEHQLIIKTPHDNEMFKNLVIKGGLFKKETGAYTDVIPSLVKFQEDLDLVPIIPSVPRFYYGFEDRENMMAVLILEDLRPYGFKMADKRKGVDFKHSQLVVEELAKMHALSVALKNRNPENLKNQYDYVFEETHFQPAFESIQQASFNKLTKQVVAIVNSTSVDEAFKAQVDKILKLDLFDAIQEALKPAEPFAVVCHGDPWCNNMLFRHKEVDGSEIPVEVKLLDLQLVRYALPTTDLAYFFFMSTTRSMRKAHFKDLLKKYHSTFMETLAHVNFEFPEFTYDVLEKMYKKTAMFGFIVGLSAAIMILANPEVHKDHGRHANPEEAIEKIDSIIGQIDDVNMALINERLVGSFEDAIELGILKHV